NSDVGIELQYPATVTANSAYSNGTGIFAASYYGGNTVTNNLVYANTNNGIWISGAYYHGLSTIDNNTVYQAVGDAVKIDGGTQNVSLRNNILWVDAGYDLRVAADSETGLLSDYNTLYTTGTGKLGQWEGRDFTNRADWFYEVGLDQHSLTGD